MPHAPHTSDGRSSLRHRAASLPVCAALLIAALLPDARAGAQAEPGRPAAPVPSQRPPVTPPPRERPVIRPEDINPACADQLLARMREVFRTANAIVAEIDEETVLGGYAYPRVVHAVRFHDRQSAYVADSVNRLTIKDGHVHLVNINRPGEYARVPYAGDLIDAMSGNRSVSTLLAALYAGRNEAWILHELRLGNSEANLRVVTCTDVTLDDGRVVRRVLFSNEGGDTWLDIDPETALPVGARSEFMAYDGMIAAERTFRIRVQIMDRIAEPLEFDGTGMIEWATIPELLSSRGRQIRQAAQVDRPLAVGDGIEPFTLRTLGGRRFDVATGHGGVKVLGFWTADSSDAPAFLRELDACRAWIESEKLPGQVFAVNTLDRRNGVTRWEHVTDLWESIGIPTVCLFDEDSTVAKKCRVTQVPTLLVVGPDGKVSAMWVDRNTGFTDDLRAAVREAASAAK